MTPPNEHSSEGGRDDRGVPYHAESTLSSAQVLKYEWGWARHGDVIDLLARAHSTLYVLLAYWEKRERGVVFSRPLRALRAA